MSDDLLICEQCGTDNPPDATFCLICGHDLRLPRKEDTGDPPSPEETKPGSDETESDLPELMRDLHSENTSSSIRRSALFRDQNSTKTDSSATGDGDEANVIPGSSPWLDKIRKRAQEEEDATGELIKKVAARDQTLESSAEDSVRDEFEGWLGQVKATARRDKSTHGAEPVEATSDGDDIPTWLKKVRDSEAEEAEKDRLAREKLAAAQSQMPNWVKEQPDQPAAQGLDNESTQKIKIIAEIRGEPVPVEEEPVPVDQPGEPEALSVERDLVAEGSVQDPSLAEPLGEEVVSLADSHTEKAWEEIAEKPVSDLVLEQRSRAEMVKTLLATEGRSVEVPPPPEKKKTRLFRFLLALLLLLAVCSPFFFGNSTFNQEGSLPNAGQEFFDQITLLGSANKVLIVLDYPAGLSAEMEMVSKPVFSHLMQKGLDLSLISSQPEGVWLARRLIEGSQPAAVPVKINYLGYLPGARLGLYNASLGSPLNLIAGLDSNPAQQDEVTLFDFDVMIILVDSLQSARNWIELVIPGFAGKPVLMISSAQEVSMLLPYVDSAQIDGMLAGLQESSLYAATLGEKTQTAMVWRSYQAGLLVMLGLMLVGVVIRLESSSAEYAIKETKS
jgi:ribosomal protein L40E